MPHALTSRQREYLDFIRNYVSKNESSPRLEEIADHFAVTAPTAHNALRALQSKGYLFFGRDSVSGFFIRLVDRPGGPEQVVEVPIAGKVNAMGEILDFPKQHGHFSTMVIGTDPGKVFALAVTEDIPQANMVANDLLLCEYDRYPLAGDIGLFPFGNRYFLIQLQSKSYDQEVSSWVMRQEYPIPKDLAPNRDQLIHWFPLAFDKDNEDYFYKLAKETGLPESPMKEEWVLAVCFRLIRQLAF